MRSTNEALHRVKAFLQEWANLKADDGKALQRFWLKLNGRLSPVTEPGKLSPWREAEYLLLADRMREFWRETDLNRKFYLGYSLVEWAVSHVRDRLNVQAGLYKEGETVILVGHLPEEEQLRPYPLESAFISLLQNARFTATCTNPECPAPFYFRVKPRQKYCNQDCARWAIRRSQRAYWTEKGKVARKARKRKPDKSSGPQEAARKKIKARTAGTQQSMHKWRS
jgi:hypothetical protein